LPCERASLAVLAYFSSQTSPRYGLLSMSHTKFLT
jgi:hypothetical protein